MKPKKENKQPPSRKIGAVGKLLIFTIIAAGGLVLVNHLMLRGDPAPPSAPLVDVEPEHLLRPRVWIYGPSVSERPAPQDVERFAAWLADGRAHTAERGLPDRPLTDPETLERIRSAQRLVAAQDSLPGAWRWDEVRRVVAGLGSAHPLWEPGEQRGPSVFAHDSRTNRFHTTPSAVRALTDGQLAEILVHEATHHVEKTRTAELAGFDGDDFVAMSFGCLDMFAAFMVATEGLAFWNEAAWRRAHPNVPLVSPDHGVMIGAALQALAGSEFGRNAFADELWLYADFSGRQFRIGELGPARRCGHPPIILLGSRRGEYFWPSDVAPDILVPIFNALLRPSARRTWQ